MANTKNIDVASLSHKSNPSAYAARFDNYNSILYDKNVRIRKDSNAAYHLVPFLLKVLEIDESDLTKAISKSIVDLDNLAQQIDNIIDNDENSPISSPTFRKFNDLENKIVDCFNYLAGSPKLEKLIIETLAYVDESFKYNTVDRPHIYNLRNTDYEGCTTYYLFPLIKHLCSFSRIPIKNDHLFFLIANYIQILDDFIDIFDDKQMNIITPITIRFNELENESKSSSLNETPFKILSQNIQNALICYFNEIHIETHRLNKNLNEEIFTDWKIFQKQLISIQIPLGLSKYKQKSYLKKIHDIVPPFLCYVG